MEPRPTDPPSTAEHEHREETTSVCMMCKRSFPSRQLAFVSGRQLCFSCLSVWFGDETE
jgi:hypothetical protein